MDEFLEYDEYSPVTYCFGYVREWKSPLYYALSHLPYYRIPGSSATLPPAPLITDRGLLPPTPLITDRGLLPPPYHLSQIEDSTHFSSFWIYHLELTPNHPEGGTNNKQAFEFENNGLFNMPLHYPLKTKQKNVIRKLSLIKYRIWPLLKSFHEKNIFITTDQN